MSTVTPLRNWRSVKGSLVGAEAKIGRWACGVALPDGGGVDTGDELNRCRRSGWWCHAVGGSGLMPRSPDQCCRTDQHHRGDGRGETCQTRLAEERSGRGRAGWLVLKA